MASQRVYEAQLRTALNKLGRAAYEQLYPEPFLVFLGVSGQLDAKISAETTTVSFQNDAPLEINSLVGRVFFLNKNGAVGSNVTVGRDAESDVPIPEYSISKRHCEFLFESGNISLRDLGSTNGTEVNGTRLAPGATLSLTGGETVMMGRFTFRFDLPRTFGAP